MMEQPGDDPPRQADRRARRRAAVLALAVGQTIGYASLYYIFAALVLAWERDTGWSRAEITLAMTLGSIRPISTIARTAAITPILMPKISPVQSCEESSHTCRRTDSTSEKVIPALAAPDSCVEYPATPMPGSPAITTSGSPGGSGSSVR